MALSTYFKPDVEVSQEFRNLNPVINNATLQSVIIGPSYIRLKDFNDENSDSVSLGSYAKEAIELNLPSLPPNSDILEDTLKVIIKNYAGEHEIAKTDVRTQGNSAELTASTLTIVDNNKDFQNLGIVESAGVSDHDGDFFRVLYGPAAGYYEIQSIVDANTLVVDDPEGVLAAAGDLSNLEYTIGNFGWMLTDDSIVLSPRLSDNGIVYLSGSARRKDYTDRLVIAKDVNELESIFGAGEVNSSNPLAYGMSKALPALGANEIILGIMVEDDTPLAYQRAFEALEPEEVYCMVPLTTDPIVHQILQAHVNAMSTPEQKKERIGLFNTARQTRVIKSGYFGRQDPVTEVWDSAKGNITATGTPLSDVVQAINESFMSDGSGIAQVENVPADYNRLVVYYRPNSDFVLEYSLNSNPGVYIDATSNFDSDGVLRIQLSGDSFENIRFTSNASYADNCEIYYMQTLDEPAGAEIFYPVLVSGTTQMDNPYITPSAGHEALKIRVYDKDNPGEDMLDGDLPGGMSLRVSYGNGLTRDVSTAGVQVFDSDISTIYVSHDAAAADIDRYVVEVMALVNAGTYAINRLTDENATFLSNNVVSQEDELVIIDKSVIDESTYSNYKETRYLISSVESEFDIEISKVWNEEAGIFEVGQFPEIEEDLYYRVETPVVTNKYVLAKWYRDISKGFNDRRMTHIFAPAVGVSEGSISTIPVPGYYFACAYAGSTQSDVPQRGFTNKSFPGFSRVFYTNAYFTEAQMNVIAEGGTTIVVQYNTKAPLSVRHQLTTNMDSIEQREYSVTKNLDHMAKTARASFRKYIGRYLINDETLSTLYKLGAALVERWKKKGQLIRGSVDQFVVDPTQADKVVACFNMKVPLPLNYIRLIFVI